MKKVFLILSVIFMIVAFSGFQSERSQIEGVSCEVYQRGIDFITYLDETPMVGQQEGEDMLNAIAEDGAPDSEALYEDVIYILWLYHNLKCMDSAAEELNETWRELGKTKTVQEEYADCRDSILAAKNQEDLWAIWNGVSSDEGV